MLQHLRNDNKRVKICRGQDKTYITTQADVVKLSLQVAHTLGLKKKADHMTCLKFDPYTDLTLSIIRAKSRPEYSKHRTINIDYYEINNDQRCIHEPFFSVKDIHACSNEGTSVIKLM